MAHKRELSNVLAHVFGSIQDVESKEFETKIPKREVEKKLEDLVKIELIKPNKIQYYFAPSGTNIIAVLYGKDELFPTILSLHQNRGFMGRNEINEEDNNFLSEPDFIKINEYHHITEVRNAEKSLVGKCTESKSWIRSIYEYLF